MAQGRTPREIRGRGRLRAVPSEDPSETRQGLSPAVARSSSPSPIRRPSRLDNGSRGNVRGTARKTDAEEILESGEAPSGYGYIEPLRGRERLALIRDLAMGEWDDDSIGAKYGVDIEEFRDQYQEEISEVSAALAGHLSIETAGLWVTHRQKRLAEYQQAIEDIDSAIRGMPDGVTWSRAHRDMFRARLDLFRQVADELGAYPQRQAAPQRSNTGVRYVIEAENVEEMT